MLREARFGDYAAEIPAYLRSWCQGSAAQRLGGTEGHRRFSSTAPLPEHTFSLAHTKGFAMLDKCRRLIAGLNPLATEWRRFRIVFGIPSVILVIGVLFTQSLINVLTNHLSLSSDVLWLACLGAGLFAALVRYRWSYQRATKESQSSTSDHTGPRLSTKRCLVCVIGLDSASASSPLAVLLSQFKNLEYLVLLGTSETRALGVANQITHQMLGAAGLILGPDQILVSEQGDAGTMDDFDLATRQAISWLLHRGATVDEIICDVTAGKRAMGFGVLLAADRAGIETQYLDSGWDHLAMRQVPGRLSFKVAREFNSMDLRA